MRCCSPTHIIEQKGEGEIWIDGAATMVKDAERQKAAQPARLVGGVKDVKNDILIQ